MKVKDLVVIGLITVVSVILLCKLNVEGYRDPNLIGADRYTTTRVYISTTPTQVVGLESDRSYAIFYTTETTYRVYYGTSVYNAVVSSGMLWQAGTVIQTNNIAPFWFCIDGSGGISSPVVHVMREY